MSADDCLLSPSDPRSIRPYLVLMHFLESGIHHFWQEDVFCRGRIARWNDRVVEFAAQLGLIAFILLFACWFCSFWSVSVTWVHLNAVSLHVWCLLYAWTQVGLLDLVHFWDWLNLSGSELLLDNIFFGQKFILQIDVVPDVVRSDFVVGLFVLDPSVVLECVLEKHLEFSLALNDLCFGSGVINCEGQLEPSLASTLPEVLTILLGLCMVKFTETSKS